MIEAVGRMKEDVTEERKLAREIGAEKYVECELMSMKGVKDVFDEVSLQLFSWSLVLEVC